MAPTRLFHPLVHPRLITLTLSKRGLSLLPYSSTLAPPLPDSRPSVALPPRDTGTAWIPPYSRRTPYIWGRMFYSSASAEFSQSHPRPPPTTQLIDLVSEEWEEPRDCIAKVSLVSNQFNNRLITHADAKLGPYDLSKEGKSLLHSLILLVLININRGYCIKPSLCEGNILVTRRFNQFGLKEALVCDSEECDCERSPSCSFNAAKDFFIKILQESEGSDITACLSANVSDLLYNMSYPAEEQLIVFHPALLSAEGRASLNRKIYRLLCKEWRNSRDLSTQRTAKEIAMSQRYCDASDNWTTLVAKYPLLDRVYKTNMKQGLVQQQGKVQIRGHTYLEGIKLVSLNYHVPHHCFDKLVLSPFLQKNKIPCLPYTFEDVMSLLNAALPLYQLGAIQAFLAFKMFDQLEMHNFFPKVLDIAPVCDQDLEGRFQRSSYH